jgi:hypothetical protein
LILLQCLMSKRKNRKNTAAKRLPPVGGAFVVSVTAPALAAVAAALAGGVPPAGVPGSSAAGGACSVPAGLPLSTTSMRVENASADALT